MRSVLATLVLLALAPFVAAQEPARASAPSAAAAEAKPARLALVIGNAKYKDAPLANPANDAADVAKALEASGFTVLKRENATLREMHLALREFGDRLGRQSTGLFYFAGHGLQVRGRNYLLPVDADVAREDEVAFQALELGAVMEKLDSAKNPVNIVILDACRNNPFGSRLQASVKGLAQVDAPPGTLIAFSTAPGSTAADGSGRNGLYTQHLVRHMDRPGLAIEEVFKATRAAVRTDSKNTQIPWESTSLESEFNFRRAPPAPKVVAAAKPAPEAAASAKRALPAHVAAPPLFAVGDTWTYRFVNELDASERQITMRVARVAGDDVEYASGEVSDSVGNYRRSKRRDGSMQVFTPSAQTYVFPLVAGSAVTLQAVQQAPDWAFDLSTELRVGAEEEVVVPAGKYRAIPIERITRWKRRDGKGEGTNTTKYWYTSATKRYVKHEEVNVLTNGKVIERSRRELVKYEVQ